uniref:Uncharacterized protein n=1 Tax=Mustela putorius furo TaxID=9669 RepID=M3XSQ5_MUSPF
MLMRDNDLWFFFFFFFCRFFFFCFCFCFCLLFIFVVVVVCFIEEKVSKRNVFKCYQLPSLDLEEMKTHSILFQFYI